MCFHVWVCVRQCEFILAVTVCSNVDVRSLAAVVEWMSLAIMKL
jgi:hypothetical protein